MRDARVGRIEFGPAYAPTADDILRDARIAALEAQTKQLTTALLAVMQAHQTLLQTLALATATRKEGEGVQ